VRGFPEGESLNPQSAHQLVYGWVTNVAALLASGHARLPPSASVNAPRRGDLEDQGSQGYKRSHRSPCYKAGHPHKRRLGD